jgi:hypothetical protein
MFDIGEGFKMPEKPRARTEPPHDRPVLALVKNANSHEMHAAVWIVAEWNDHAEEWRPVRVHGDPDSGIKLELLAWNDITPADDEVWQQPSAFPGPAS